jgi:adenosine deaminase
MIGCGPIEPHPDGLRTPRKTMPHPAPVEAIDRLQSLPKAEVHLHLEGCFEPEMLERWAAQAGVAMPRPREQLLNFTGLADFLQFLDWACSLASTRERLADLCHRLGERLAAAGAGYADVIVNPTHWPAWHGRLAAMIDAIDAGFTAAEQDGLPPAGLCAAG